MPKHPAEVFGYRINVQSREARKARKRHWCPFANQKCDKKSRLIRYPMGVCSAQYGAKVIALCPKRFLQDHTVFRDIADHYFGGSNDLLIFSEVALRDVGTFDYVMVKHEPMSSEIQDFAIIEFQTGQTTGTGELVRGLQDFLSGHGLEGENYGFGLNLADIWKRSLTQILNKGIVVERWRQKIYWVVQEPVYQDLLGRYSLKAMTYHQSHATVFALYDLKPVGSRYDLFRTQIESSTTDHLFEAFRNNPRIPSKDDFVDKLGRKLKARLGLKLKPG